MSFLIMDIKGWNPVPVVPAFTEDGIPIRKIYVTNLPLKVTRRDLYEVFTQFGVIQRCWIKPSFYYRGCKKPVYAFVTYFNPKDAYSALTAPFYKKCINGHQLHTYAADSWHQPMSGSNHNQSDMLEDHSCPQLRLNENKDASRSKSCLNLEEFGFTDVNKVEEDLQNKADCPSQTIIDILNRDCLMYIFSFISLKELIGTERVSKSWLNVLRDFYSCTKIYKTSWWTDNNAKITTANLRQLLIRIGPSLLRLHIDHSWMALNDRTAHSIGKFCPNLEEFKIVNLETTNWKPVIYGCKKLKKIHFKFCRKISDYHLLQFLKQNSSVEMIKVTNNKNINGYFLDCRNPSKLTSVELANCPMLQYKAISEFLPDFVNLTSLKLDNAPDKVWDIIPLVLNKLPKLKKLSLQDYVVNSANILKTYADTVNNFKIAFANLKQLRTLKLRYNIYINDDILTEIAKNCQALEYLNLTNCNGSQPHFKGVTDKGVVFLCGECTSLNRLDLSAMSGVGDAGAAACARLPGLHRLLLRSNRYLTTATAARVVYACHNLQNLNLSGCGQVDGSLLLEAAKALDANPRPLFIRMGGTKYHAQFDRGSPPVSPYPPTNHKLLTVNIMENFPKSDWRYGYEESLTYHNAEELDLEELHEIINENPDMADIFFDNNDDDFLSDSDLDVFDDELEFYYSDFM